MAGTQGPCIAENSLGLLQEEGKHQACHSSLTAVGKMGHILYLFSIDCSPTRIILCRVVSRASRSECVCVHMYIHTHSPVHTLILLKQQEEHSACY